MSGENSPASLLIIGAGRLGSTVLSLWHGEVVPETLTPRTHRAFLESGFAPRLRQEPLDREFDHILFTIPPSTPGFSYRDEAKRAATLPRKGRLVLVSSTAVYAEENGGEVTEGSALATTPRATTLLEAEAVVLEAGGSVVRLAGLYSVGSGPHWVYQSQETSVQRGDGILNLIHRADAASLVVQALRNGQPGMVYLGCDGAPLTRDELCRLNAKAHGNTAPCIFTGIDGPLGKRCNNRITRKLLGWQPTFPSFEHFIKSLGPNPNGTAVPNRN